MNKKILGGTLLGFAVTLPLFAVAVSCDIDQKVDEEKIKKELNDLGDKITIDYPDKQNLFPDKANIGRFVSKNYDENKFEVEVKKVTSVDESIATVTFLLRDKTTGIISNEFTKTIEGFGTSKTEDEKLAEVARIIILDYNNKQRVSPTNVVIKDVIVSNYNREKYEVDLKNISFDIDRNVWVIFSVKSKATGKTSSDVRRQINGFDR